MRLSGTRVYYRPTPPKMPPGLVELMEGLTKEVLKQNPSDIYSFCADHLQHLLEIRDGVPVHKRITLEEKIAYVQEKMRQKAEKRRELYDKKLLLQQDIEETNLKNNIVEDQELSAPKEQISVNNLIQVTKFSNVQQDLPDDGAALESNNEVADEATHFQDKTAKQLVSLSDAEILQNEELQVTPNDNEFDRLDEDLTEPNIGEADKSKVHKFCDTTSHMILEIPQNTTADKFELGSSDKDMITESVNIILVEGVNFKDNKPYKHDIDLNKTQEKDDQAVQDVAPSQIHLATPVIPQERNIVAKVGNASEGLDLEVSNGTQADEKYSIHDNEIVDKNITVTDMNYQKVPSSSNDITNNGYIFEDYAYRQIEYEKQATISPVDEGTAQQSESAEVQEYDNDIIKTQEHYNYHVIHGTKDTKDLTEHDKEHYDNDLAKETYDTIQEPSDNNKTKLADTDANHEKHDNDQTTRTNVLKFEKSYDLPTSDTDCDVDTLVTDDIVCDSQHVEDNLNITELNNILTVPTDRKEITNEFQTTASPASDINEADKTEDEINSNQDEAILNSDNESSSMNLETAAITIQKVFRSFLFKSRASTFEDFVNEDQSFVDEEDKSKEESDFPIVLNSERRQLGLTRMDTVLQTVNEEKSLSLSTDDSSTLSSAATIIQAHVRGYLVRNKLNSNKTSSNSLVASISNERSLTSIEADNDQNKNNKTVLNIHIVPEGSDYLTRDESLITSVDLSLDSSPPSSINLHPLGYDKSERRKQLKREDAIQSVSPPSNNSGKLSEDVESVKDLPLNDQVTSDQVDLSRKPIEANLNKENNKMINKILPEAHEESKIEVDNNESKNNHLAIDKLKEKRKSLSKMSSDERDVVTPSGEDNTAESKLLHSGEFHDVVLPTEVSRRDSSVVSEFKNVLVYFLLWNHS